MEGTGFLQVDFANKYVGGGVLGLGCVQEEIRFVICPELMVTMLVTEKLDDTEALIVSGVERYSRYKGYSNSFKWVGDYVDETPRDSSGRRLTSIVAIDALYFAHSQSQFSISNIKRELNKAYVGFVGCEGSKSNLPAVATGNWGCGAFRGDPKLKVLLQLMAAAITGRSMVYFTFGDTNLRDEIAEIYTHFIKHEINIANIFSLLVQYQEFASSGNSNFYRFLYNRSKMKPLAQFLNKNSHRNIPATKDVGLRASKNINNGEIFHLDIKKHCKTEEEKIQDWLDDIDEDAMNEKKTDFLKRECVDGVSEKEQIQSKDSEKKKEGQVHNGDSAEKKKKQSLWAILGETGQSKTNQERRLSGLGLLDTKHESISHYTNNDCSQSTKDESRQSQSKPVVSHSTPKSVQSSSGQRKISDFFQRTR